MSWVKGSPGLKAVCLLVGALLIVLAIDFAVPQVESTWNALSFVSACASGDFSEDTVVRGADEDVPDWLMGELSVPQRARSLKCSGGGDVVGFELDGSAEDAFKELSDALSDGGWLMVESGIPGCATFYKNCGACRWTLLSCVGNAGSTSVVMQNVVLDDDERDDT